MQLSKEQLLAEVEDLLRTMPSAYELTKATPDNLAWLGRNSAIIEQWKPSKSTLCLAFALEVRSRDPISAAEGAAKLMALLHQARHDLRVQTVGPMSVAVSAGKVFDYFDELRKVLEQAKQDLLFVDPYLDAEFVSRYLPHAAKTVTIRLLTRERLQTLLPAVGAFCQQNSVKIEVRAAPKFHDRYVFIDQTICYHSGASFKDGAKSAPTTLTQIMDAFAAVHQTYETLWKQATIHK